MTTPNFDDFPAEYLWCRDVQHSWDNYDAKITRSRVTRRNEIHQVLICTRCTTTKTRVMTASGELLRASYAYPKGYALRAHGRMTPADRGMIRTHNLRRSGALDGAP